MTSRAPPSPPLTSSSLALLALRGIDTSTDAVVAGLATVDCDEVTAQLQRLLALTATRKLQIATRMADLLVPVSPDPGRGFLNPETDGDERWFKAESMATFKLGPGGAQITCYVSAVRSTTNPQSFHAYLKHGGKTLWSMSFDMEDCQRDPDVLRLGNARRLLDASQITRWTSPEAARGLPATAAVAAAVYKKRRGGGGDTEGNAAAAAQSSRPAVHEWAPRAEPPGCPLQRTGSGKMEKEEEEEKEGEEEEEEEGRKEAGVEPTVRRFLTDVTLAVLAHMEGAKGNRMRQLMGWGGTSKEQIATWVMFGGPGLSWSEYWTAEEYERSQTGIVALLRLGR